VPVAAARLAHVGARDTQPLVLRGSREHFLEQVAVPSLQLIALPERQVGLPNPLRQRVAHALELVEAGDPRLAEASRDAGVEREPRKRSRAEARKLMLETTDLTSQLGAGKALVAPYPKRCQRVSVEQIRHRTNPSVDHRRAPENEQRIKSRFTSSSSHIRPPAQAAAASRGWRAQ